MLHHMFGDKQCEDTRDWHVEVYVTREATGYFQSHTVLLSQRKPTYTKPDCDLTTLQASAGRIWLYLVVRETEVSHVIRLSILDQVREEVGVRTGTTKRIKWTAGHLINQGRWLTAIF